jgi:3'(2'), 5'-bisphosphate nucleotidase/inositol polyphosphate 1-phosphatase
LKLITEQSSPFCSNLQILINRFVKGEEYAVALALLVEGKVVLGVMACPKLENHKSSSSGCLFFATVGEGAYVQSLEGDSHPPQKVL